MGSLAIFEYEGTYGTTLYLDAISLSKFVEYVGGVDASSVEEDEDAEDIDLGMEAVEANDVQEESAEDTDNTETPRV